MNRLRTCGARAALIGVLAALATPASADIAVSSNDSHTILVNGAQVAPKSPTPDTLSVIDLGHYPPKIVATIDAPGSVVGPRWR